MLCSAVLFALALLAAMPSALKADGDDLVRKRMASCPDTPNCVSSLEEGEAHIAPLETSVPVEKAMDAIRSFLKEQKRCRIVTDEPAYLHAEFTSLIFRFKDDLEILAPPTGRVLHIRSASRVGHSDLGVNRKRVERIRRALSLHVSGRNSPPAGGLSRPTAETAEPSGWQEK